jgi:hypothetical protein
MTSQCSFTLAGMARVWLAIASASSMRLRAILAFDSSSVLDAFSGPKAITRILAAILRFNAGEPKEAQALTFPEII